ncbi:ABC transporter substrate-binding protein [Bacillus sp. FSL K6-3431]|uniref:ABC transporter substrate-binding protein n=1 Tax=Bacillus sp. FSL K6-3431 TaxID=2921500 RepID=UPI0030F7455E
MKRLTNLWAFGLLLLISIFLLAACNGGNTANDASGNKNEEEKTEKAEELEAEPVTLKFNYAWEEEFNEDIKGPVEEKFPHITLEFVEMALDEVETEIAQKNIPDIFYLSGGDQVPLLEEYELTYDLDELINGNNFDLSSISQAHIYQARGWGDGALYYFPYVRRWEVLYYNKEIFDQFGVSYPKDGMTWGEVGDLASQVTGERNGVEYRGLDISAAGGMLSELEVNHLDPESHEPMYVKDERFVQYLNMAEKLAAIPGVVPEEGDWGDFMNTQNLAMVPLFDVHIWLAGVEADTGLNWDMVTYPVWEDKPNGGPGAGAAGLAISETSEHKEEAFQVLEYLMSEEWQLMRSKKGFATILNDPEIQGAFSSEVEGLQDKNMQAVFALDIATGPKVTSPYEQEGQVLDVMEFIKEGNDVNTYLREAYDKSKAKVAEAQGSK